MRWGILSLMVIKRIHCEERVTKAALVPSPLLHFYVTLTGWPLGSFSNELTPQHCHQVQVPHYSLRNPHWRADTTNIQVPHRVIALQNILCAKQLFGYFHIYSLKHLLLVNRVLLCNADGRQTHDSPASPSQVLEPHVCTTTPGFWNPFSFCF